MFLQRVQPIFNGVKSESHSETGKLKKSRDFFNFFVTLCNKSYLHPSYS